MKQIVFDIEANGLKPTKVWVIVASEVASQETKVFSGDTLKDFNDYIKDAEVIGHNIIGYDIPVLERLLGTDFSSCKVTDTLVLSRLADPQREGGHSLESWGLRLGFPKGEHNDWEQFSQAMVDYCKQDVLVNVKVFQALRSVLADFRGECVSLEHNVQAIIQNQIDNGWLLDCEHAFGLLGELKEKKFDLEEQVHDRFKPLATFVKEIQPKFKKDGSMSVVGLKFLGDLWESVGGEFSRVDFPEFNLGSRQQIGRYLQYFGWKPEKFTEKGQAIVDEAILSQVDGIPEAVLIAKYLMVQKRMAQVQSWIDAVEDDGRVHGFVNSNGAVTGRMTHSSPNLAQCPSVSAEYGKECRECWTSPKGYKIVGMDASGLELRMLAHYMNDEEYTNEILNGDIHTANQLACGVDTRNQAKTFIYAFLYGAGDDKIGSIVGGNGRDGRRLKRKFLENTPSLASLRERVSVASRRGYLYGLDGRRVTVRSEHAALNTLLQSAGAVVMKQALVLVDEYAKKWGIDYKFVANVHDEIQVEVKEEQAEKFGQLAIGCMEAAGKHFKLNCPLAGEFKIGDNWAETH
jgi:DNA polymerase I-like protein with 3'-5' exonuclease and polymerase domains